MSSFYNLYTGKSLSTNQSIFPKIHILKWFSNRNIFNIINSSSILCICSLY